MTRNDKKFSSNLDFFSLSLQNPEKRSEIYDFIVEHNVLGEMDHLGSGASSPDKSNKPGAERKKAFVVKELDSVESTK
jgi:hypothetical protein